MSKSLTFFKKQPIKGIFTFVLMWLAGIGNLLGQSPEGVWKTIDDETGKAKSWVEIYQHGDKYFGKIIKLLDAATTTVCDKCPGAQKGKPLVGMVILSDLAVYKDYWSNGTIFDPKSGNKYGCSVWFDDQDYSKLKVRGKHWSGLFRDQTWYKIN